MFNEKALVAANRAARKANNNKGGMDEIDREAERQGNARGFFSRNEVGPQVMGRRISKQNRELDGSRKTADNRAAKNLVKDTLVRMNERMVSKLSLMQK